MPRKPRIDLAGQIYHVILRANAKIKIFISQDDYLLFENTFIQALKKFDMRNYVYELMPNHIHLALSPEKDGGLSKFMHWVTMTFTQRYHSLHRSAGTGHLFQGRYKAFIVKDDKYLLQLFMYIERNAINANLVKNAEDWRWSSLWVRVNGSKSQKKCLSAWPIEMPENYIKILNSTMKINPDNLWIKKEKRGRPFKNKGS